MNGISESILEHLDAKEMVNVLSKAIRTIQTRANKESWPFMVRNVRGGQKKLYIISSLPEDVKFAVGRYYANQMQAGGDLFETIAEERTFVSGRGSHESATLSESIECGNTSLPVASEELPLPIWSKKIALARFDLLQEFIEAKQTGKKRGEKVSVVITNFIEVYNRGSLFPKLFETLGTVSRSTLQRWLKDLESSRMDYRVLAPRWGKHRSQTTKLTELEKLYFEKELLTPNRVKIGTAIEFTKMLLKHEGLSSPSGPSAFRAYAKRLENRYNHIWTLLRKGEKALIDECLPYLMRDDSKLEVGDVLTADGHRCNFFVKNPFTGKPARPLLIVFYDWKSRDFCGADIGFEENVQGIHNALRNAILNLGKTPNIVYLDNGKAFKAKVFTKKDFDLKTAGVQGVYARLNIKVMFAKPYNARSKIVERSFRDLDNSLSRHLSSFCGSSIEDKPATLNRNENFMRSLYPKYIPEVSEVFQTISHWHKTFYRNRPHPTIKGKTKGDVFDEGRGSGVDEVELRTLMMSHDVRKIYRNGIRMLGGFYWDVALYGFREKVIVKYEFNDLAKVHVYLSSTGDYLCTAKRVEELNPIARYKGSPKDYEEYRRQLKSQDKLKKDTKKLARRVIENTGESFNSILESVNLSAIDPRLPGQIEEIETKMGVNDEFDSIPVIDADLLATRTNSNHSLRQKE